MHDLLASNTVVIHSILNYSLIPPYRCLAWQYYLFSPPDPAPEARKIRIAYLVLKKSS